MCAAQGGLQLPAVQKTVLLRGGTDAPSRRHPERLDGRLVRLSGCIVEKGLRPNAWLAVPPPGRAAVGLLLALAGGSFLSLSRGELSLRWLRMATWMCALNARLLACFPFRLQALPQQCWKCPARAPGGLAGSCLPGEPQRGLPACSRLLPPSSPSAPLCCGFHEGKAVQPIHLLKINSFSWKDWGTLIF